MTPSWRLLLTAAIAGLLLLNLAQFAINEELRWRFEQIERSIAVVDRDPQDIPKPDPAEFKVIRFYGWM